MLGVAVALLVVLLDLAGVFAGSSPSHAAALPAVEAGVEPSPLDAAVTGPTVLSTAAGVQVLGGSDAAGTPVATTAQLTGLGSSTSSQPSLAVAVTGAAGCALPSGPLLLGGGTPSPASTVQQLADGRWQVIGALPSPREGAAGVTVTSHGVTTCYVVGGTDGSSADHEVLATTDGVHFSVAGALPIAVFDAAVVVDRGGVYAVGGEAHSRVGVIPVATIQRLDLTTRDASVVARLPHGVEGASAFVLGRELVVAGGELADHTTTTAIDAFVPATGAVLDAGLLPQATAFAGSATVGSGSSAIGFLVGGSVAAQAGPDAAGAVGTTLATIQLLRPSPYGPPAGSPSAGSPFDGSLLIAERGSRELVVVDSSREVVWSSTGSSTGGAFIPGATSFGQHGHDVIVSEPAADLVVELAYPSGTATWSYGRRDIPGVGSDELERPAEATLLRDGNVAIADTGANRVLVVSKRGAIVGLIGAGSGASGSPAQLVDPSGVTPLGGGDLLVTTHDDVEAVTTQGVVRWSVHLTGVAAASDAIPLGHGVYLVADEDPTAEGKVVEFSSTGRVLWSYDATGGEGELRAPSVA